MRLTWLGWRLDEFEAMVEAITAEIPAMEGALVTTTDQRSGSKTNRDAGRLAQRKTRKGGARARPCSRNSRLFARPLAGCYRENRHPFPILPRATSLPALTKFCGTSLP
ncbi:MAG: hypothetical protein MZV63_72175 [Marinilabiliales bacterium]|nr:hypothetical protein [Marinilabiliales bacterium]